MGAPWRTQRLDDGQRLLVEAKDIPAMGYSVLDLREGNAPSTADVVTATERTLENALVRVAINENGEIVSLFDKQAQREVLAPARSAISSSCLMTPPMITMPGISTHSLLKCSWR